MSNQYQQGITEDTPQPSDSELQILQGQPVYATQAIPQYQVQGQPIFQQPYQPPIQQQYYQGQPNYPVQPNYLPPQINPINPIIPQWQQNAYQFQQPVLPTTADGMEYSINIQCPHCNQQSNTYIEYKMSVYSWIMVIMLFVLFIPLVWLPLFMRTQKNKIHRCNRCRNIVGKTEFRPC
ncbi:hypothetical protein pb186bvf_014229 [Paramecium bursaria]